VSFTNLDDIAGLRQHEGYEEVKNVETVKTVQDESQETPFKEMLKRGRPKSSVPQFLQE